MDILEDWSGGYAWTLIAMATAVIGILKPILNLPKEIERYSKLFIGYTGLYYDLQQIVTDIQTFRDFTEDMSKTMKSAQERVKQLALEDDPKPVENLRRRCYNEVIKEIPVTSLWVPPTE